MFLTIKTIAQNIGIGTNNPLAMLHVADSSVLFTGSNMINNNYVPPVSGPGTRMMWMPEKAAFRAGTVTGAHWDAQNIGSYSVGMGYNPTASGEFSIALGIASKALNSESFAIGSFAESNGLYAGAVGYLSKASGMGSLGFGYYANAAGINSISIGPGANSKGGGSLAIGNYTVTNAWGQVSVGVYNTEFPQANTQFWTEADPVFVVGNGTNTNFRSNALTILKNGNVGIGTNAPNMRLHLKDGAILVERNSGNGAGQLVLDETGLSDGSRITFRNTNTAGKYWELFAKTHANTPAEAHVNFYYNGVGSNLIIYGNGNAWLRGSLNQNSDARLKKDIEPLTSSVEKISSLNGYRYHWKDENLDSKWQTGLLAQEVEQVFPELVNMNAEGYKSVNYTALIPHLIETIKSLQARITKLEAKN